MYIVYIMNKLSLFLIILFVISILFLYISSTNTYTGNGESSIISDENSTDINNLVLQNNISEHSNVDKNEKRQTISSYEQKTNHSYENNDKNELNHINQDENQTSILDTLQPYSPDIFDNMNGSNIL